MKEVQDLKVSIENTTYLKSQIAGQLEDARRRLEDDERVYNINIHIKIIFYNITREFIIETFTFGI